MTARTIVGQEGARILDLARFSRSTPRSAVFKDKTAEDRKRSVAHCSLRSSNAA
jgi:hypothetical protein